MSLALRLKALLCVAVLGVGLSLFGHGLWIQAKAQLAQWLIESAWDQTLLAEKTGRSTPAKPWPWADTWPVAKLYFPRQQQALIALHGLEGNSLAFGPGMLAVKHQDVSSAEVTQVIAGHKDTHFAFLEDAAIGDTFEMTSADGRTQHFRITHVEIVDTRKVPSLNLTAQPAVVLVTCYPFGLAQQGPLRYVVYADNTDAGIKTAGIKKAGEQLALHRPNLKH